jgi:BR serine/threonine kinase
VVSTPALHFGVLDYEMNVLITYFQLADINRHPWVTAGGKGELELELPMMEVVQTHIIPSIDAMDPDVLQAISSLGCFKDREKLIQELLSPK